MIGWIVFILIMLFFIWLVFGPVRLKINTVNNKYEVILPGIFRGLVIPTEEFLIFKLWITFVPVTIDPLKSKKKKKEKVRKEQPEKPKTKKSGKPSFHQIQKLAIRVLHSFKVDKFKVNLDTGDYVLNARLIPLFSALSGTRRTLSINYNEINQLELSISTRIYNFISIAIKTFVFKS